MKFTLDTNTPEGYNSHMSFDNSVKIAFIISVFLHTFIFFASPAFIKIFIPKKTQKQLEINYYVLKKSAPVTVGRAEIVGKSSVGNAPKTLDAPGPTRTTRQEVLKDTLPKVQQPKEDATLPDKGDIVIPPLPVGLEKMPAYLDYGKSVRAKISWIANSKYRQKSHLHGEVCLNFVLLSNGQLGAVKIVNEKSTTNSHLRTIALHIIEEASPFEPFPFGLEYKHLTFAITISFG